MTVLPMHVHKLGRHEATLRTAFESREGVCICVCHILLPISLHTRRHSSMLLACWLRVLHLRRHLRVTNVLNEYVNNK